MKIAFAPMLVPDHLNPAATLFRKVQSRNELVLVAPTDPKPVARLASLTLFSHGEKALPLGLAGEHGRPFGRVRGKETLCPSLFWGSAGTSKEAERKRRSAKL